MGRKAAGTREQEKRLWKASLDGKKTKNVLPAKHTNHKAQHIQNIPIALLFTAQDGLKCFCPFLRSAHLSHLRHRLWAAWLVHDTPCPPSPVMALDIPRLKPPTLRCFAAWWTALCGFHSEQFKPKGHKPDNLCLSGYMHVATSCPFPPHLLYIYITALCISATLTLLLIPSRGSEGKPQRGASYSTVCGCLVMRI